jgi:hypothetical protein
MLIKDIRTFRDFYKTNVIEVKDTNRNPHFAGDVIDKNEREFGFFHMFNGHGDIENKLSTILNIAGDSQAIYEFMQNAVDADSKNFFLAKYGEENNPYLIVLNDGEYFTLQSLISILAIGASSKYRNPDNIGQFGVGFKLAHRLIGADNSIKELLEENKGPILFSWANGELAQLGSIENIETIDPKCSGFGGNAISTGDAPWLFKIVATNFPCLMNDKVLDAKGRPSDSLFTDNDFDALKGAARLCIKQFEDALEFKTGTLLVIPLHPSKVDHVIGKVPKGLEVAATIISRRAKKAHDLRTKIENDDLIPEKLITEQWELGENKTKGNLGNEQVKVVELMFLYGNPFESNPFKGKPQFYRYFPMSLEQHGFRFAIHSNALTLSSARTELQENDSNKYLIGEFVPLLEQRLKEHALNEQDKFCQLYASILLSNRGEGGRDWIQGRQWLESVLWLPLMQIMKNNLPIKNDDSFSLTNQPEQVVIKSSFLPIETWYRKEHGGWFYWDEKQQALLCYEAKEKLGLKSVNLLDVLSDISCIAAINEWLSYSPDNTTEFLKELNEINFEGYEKGIIWKNIFFLNLWWFGDDAISIDKLSKEETHKYHLINYGPLNEIKVSLEKVNILTSLHYLSDFPLIERHLREAAQRLLPYLFNYEELNKLLSIQFSTSTELLAEEKRAIFNSIESAVRSSAGTAQRRIDTMKPLSLFSNKRGEVKPLFQLTSVENLPQMLMGWKIKEGETSGLNLKEYLSNHNENIYEHIIKPFWKDIATQIEQSTDQRTALFGYIKRSYTLRPAMGAMPPEMVFFTKDGTQQKPFYHQSLINLSENHYNVLSELLPHIGYHLPQRTLLPFYSDAPFLLPTVDSLNLKQLPGSITADEAKILLRWIFNAFPEIVNEYIYFTNSEGEITIKPRANGVYNYSANQQDIQAYIAVHFHQTFLLLPEALNSILADHSLHSDKLLERLIFEVHNNNGNILELTLLIQKHGNDNLKQKLLSNVHKIDLTTPIKLNELDYFILKLCFSISSEQVRKEVLENLTCLKRHEEITPLRKVQNRGSDTLNIAHPQKGNLIFSINYLLGGEANSINQMLTNVSDEWEKLGLGTKDQIAMALGIKEHRNPREVWDQMKLYLEEGKVLNGEQLAFIWASGFSDQHNAPFFKVKTGNGWLPLKGPLYLQPSTFIESDKLLSGEYERLKTIVSLNNEILEGCGWTVQDAPIFKDSKLIMPGIDIINEQVRNFFWQFLFELWEENGYSERIQLSNSDKSWKQLLGLVPSEFILSDKYNLPEEMVPKKLLTSYGLPEDRISQFMAALGAHDESAPVVKTRKYFKKDGGIIDTSMTPNQYISTLKWLYTNTLSIQFEDISPFYKNLVTRVQDLIYFPAFLPGSEGLKIITLSSNVYHIHKEDLLKARNYDIKISAIASAANGPLINLGYLQDWTKYLEKNSQPLNIIWKETDWELAEEDATEWKFPFYVEWKKRYQHFKIFHLNGGEIPRRILINGNPIKQYRIGKVAISQDTNIIFVGGGDTEVLLNEIDKVEGFNINARSYLRQCYKAQAEQFEKFMELAKNDSGFAQLLMERAETIKLQEERTARADVVKNADSKYTMDWFLNLLELVRVQERSINIPEVTFTKCERVPAAEKTYELSESIGRIPSNIDSFDEIPAVITYLNTKYEPITINTKLIASEKHQKLWVMFPEAAIHPILEDPKKILSIKLEFTRTVDLIEELKNGFRRLNLQLETNLKETLSENIDFIFGPPGTGKTTELANRILNRALNGVIGPVVVLTPTNKAADVLTKKIIEINSGKIPSWLVRAGTCTDPFLLQEDVVKYGNDLIIEANSGTVLITTIHRFPYFTVPINRHNAMKSRLCDCPWAEVIFDEASMIPIAYITHAIQARQRGNAQTRFLVAGDPLQIPPVFDLLTEDLDDLAELLQQENIYSMIGLKTFNTTIQQTIPIYGNRIHNLDVQHRSIPAIGELFSKFQYEGKIKHSRGTSNNVKSGISRQLPKKMVDIGLKPITIIRYPVKSGDSIYKPKKLEESPIHLHSALLVSEIIKSFRNEVKGINEEAWTIGILAPYRSQADLMLKMIEAHQDKKSKLIITTDTVHGFQGDENKIVFAVFNPSGTGENVSYSRFLKKEFILNVAISRAEDYLIMLIPDEESKGLSGLPLIQQLIALAKQTSPDLLSIIHSTELEEKLMGRGNYFESRSFSTAHHKVNIYGKPDLPYMIKINEKSVDVHWDIST